MEDKLQDETKKYMFKIQCIGIQVMSIITELKRGKSRTFWDSVLYKQ
jgi:hypothetical protein